MKTREQVWAEFAAVVQSVQGEAPSQEQITRLAFVSLYEKFERGEWSCASVMRAINDKLFMPAPLVLAVAEGFAPPPDLAISLFSFSLPIPLDEKSLLKVYELLGRPQRREIETHPRLRDAELFRDYALQSTTAC